MQLHMLRRGAVVVLLVALAVAGCTRRSGSTGAQGAGDTGPATTQAAVTTPTTALDGSAGGGTTSTEAGGTSGEAAGTLPDGRHPVSIVAVSTTKKTVRFDLIQFLTGEAANKAAAEDGEESPPPNDYYIRNVNPKLRTLPTAPSLTVVVNVLASAETGSAIKDTKITFAKLAAYPDDQVKAAVFWLTVSHGKIIRIEEQFIP